MSVLRTTALYCLANKLIILNDRKSKAIESHFVAPSVVLGQPFHSKKLSLIFFFQLMLPENVEMMEAGMRLLITETVFAIPRDNVRQMI